MGGDLREHSIRQHPFTSAHHRGCGFVAGGFNSQNAGSAHLSILLKLREECLPGKTTLNLTTDKAQQAARVVQSLRQAGYTAYLVGGCVRDLLLGREPADYDVATSATPDDVMRLFPQTYAVGVQFGVVLVPVRRDTPEGERDNYVIEVATFRSDGLYSDSRHPDEVQFSRDAQTDVQRRDFTINGLLLDPATGEVLDYVGGREDLQRQILRTIGDARQRFTEDKLRMLRAVRFAARFGYAIDAQTFQAIRDLKAEIHRVSHERIRDEILKMLTEGRARRAFELLDETGLLAEVLPEIKRMQGVQQPPQFHPEGDVWVHTLLLLEGLEAGCSKTLALGALLHDVGKPPTFRVAPDRIRFDQHAEVGTRMAEEICRRFRLSNDETGQVCALVANHMRFGDVQKMKESTLKRFLRLQQFDEHMALHRLDCLASHRDLSLYEFAHERLHTMPAEQIRPKPLINGDDLIAAGYSPGPLFKELLLAVEDAQLEGSIATREQALALVLEKTKKLTPEEQPGRATTKSKSAADLR
ncbi:MAG: CCA tRNA nucleotidyltransferase [Acidobacteriia bacterium]|nr:CCA tRNA nucleotidyltransferase [Terriglobia bacterium]